MTIEMVVSRHDGLLGTVVEVSIGAAPEAGVDRIRSVVIDEIARLQDIFTLFDDSSELRRWQRGLVAPGPELAAVLGLAREWQDASGGAFNPMVGRLWDLWTNAGFGGQLPSLRSVASAAKQIGRPSYRTNGAFVHVIGDIGAVNLNAIAKGWIVDRAVDVAFRGGGLEAITLRAGGDLVHRGGDPLVIDIEDPVHPYADAPPVMQVALHEGAFASSGGSRRGFEIDGERFSQVLDPRSGYPVKHVASASVLAPNAATADVLATVLTVLQPDDGVAFADSVEGVACCIVAGNGAIHPNARWNEARIR